MQLNTQIITPIACRHIFTEQRNYFRLIKMGSFRKISKENFRGGLPE